MGILSNFPWLRHGRPIEIDESVPVEVRPAKGHEVHPAVRLLATHPDGREDGGHCNTLLQIAESHPQDLGGIWVAAQEDRLISAALPVLSPGRTLLLFAPLGLVNAFHGRVTRRVVDAICERAKGLGVQLAQALVDASGGEPLRVLEVAGFTRLADLIYLQGTPGRGIKEGLLSANFRWVTYSPDAHELFAKGILTSYQQSLDCPALNGVRDIEDILAGHKATGEFDPGKWFVLMDEANPDVPAGVLLLNAIPRAGVTELVYIGLAPPYRGKGLGDVLLRKALIVTGQSQYNRLSLAVDAGNAPALKMYWRQGLQAVAKKTAMLRDLR